MPFSNRAIISVAGSGKTTSIVNDALGASGKNLLITTYTTSGIKHISDMLQERCGSVPQNIELLTWQQFLLRHGCRPYQRMLFDDFCIRSINFQPCRHNHRMAKVSDARRYRCFDHDIPNDMVPEFVCRANDESGGMVMTRLEEIYDRIYVDEVQDLCGFDLDVLDLILNSQTELYLVGDPRQAIFQTHSPGNKNSRFLREKIIDWFRDREASGLLALEHQLASYRCNQAICDFANKLFPDLPDMTPASYKGKDHQVIHILKPQDLSKYITKYNPKLLKYDVRTETYGYSALNIGVSKGSQCHRVLIFPSKKTRAFLSGASESPGDAKRLYIAVTRARLSAAFCVEQSNPLA